MLSFFLLTGFLCHLEDACVSNPCHRNAECFTNPSTGDAVCSCRKGYEGSDCSLDINECEFSKFVHHVDYYYAYFKKHKKMDETRTMTGKMTLLINRPRFQRKGQILSIILTNSSCRICSVCSSVKISDIMHVIGN